MKRKLQKLFALLVVLFVPFFISAQEYGSILKESFENGIPKEWTQEKVSGSIDWTIESGELTHPSTSFDGGKRVAFRNETGVTSRAKTRLISPEFDAVSLYQPIIIFAHAQDKWTDDVDTLRVLYRTAADKDWVELKVFDKCISKWQIDTLRLIGATKTYQVAFEATDNLGRGVVLDNIEVRSTPSCIAPYNFTISNVSNDSVTLGWLGAFDAVSFDIKVDTVALTAEQLADPNHKAQICDVTVSNAWNYTIKGLTAGNEYYFYMKSNCLQESSEWTGDKFSTSNFLKIPYKENFNNVEKTTGSNVSYPEYWMLYGTDKKPYINSNYTGSIAHNFSVDTTFAFCFGGSNSSDCGTAMTAGHYAYAVLPQVNIDNITDLQISFWSISYWPTRIDRSSIVVGVMTDPENKSSFVPVDTITNVYLREHKQYVVSLENYEGEGKYITFMSDFPDRNLFIIENLEVDYRPEVMKVNFDVQIPSATSIKLDFDKVYDKYEVMVTREEIDVNNIADSKVILTTEITNAGEITKIPSESFVFVYARGVKGNVKGEWSNSKRIRMPAKIETYPYLVDFEINEDDETTFYRPYWGYDIVASGTMLPNNVTYVADNYIETPEAYDLYWNQSSPGTNLQQRSNYELNMSGYTQYRDAYCVAIFPEMTDVKNTRVGFFACKHSASATSFAGFYVGIMSDANDFSTFECIDTIYPEQRYSYHIYDFDKYEGQGKFFAIMVNHMDYSYTDDNVGNDYIYAYVDDVSFTKIPECRNPYEVNVEYNEADPSKITLSWDASGATSWNVRVAGEDYEYDSLLSANNLSYVYNQTVTTNSLELSNLEYPGKKYYYWIQASDGSNTAEWSRSEYFETKNYAQYPLPFIEDFDKEWYSTAANRPEFAAKSLQTQQIYYSSSYYPYLSEIQKASGTKSMVFYKSSSWIPKGANLYVALPKMADSVNKLQLSFKMMVSKTEQVISVGVMTNPLDSTTQEEVSKVKPRLATEWVEYIVTFDSYQGNGEYIYIATDDSYPSIYSAYIDDIKVEYINPCGRPENVALVDISDTQAQFSWTSSAQGANILISKKRLTPEELVSPIVNSDIVAIKSVTSNPGMVDGLEANTSYFAYVQAVCGDEESSAWSNPLPFRTPCVVLDSYHLGVEYFDQYGTGNGKYPTCYIVGNKTDGATVAFIPSCQTSWKNSGGASLKLQSSTTYNGAYAITPRLDISDIAMLRVKFWASAHTYTSSTYAHSLVVGVVTDPTALETFVPVDTLSLAKEGRPFEVYFDKYKGDLDENKGKYVMFLSEFDLNNYAFIDDVQFDTIPTCVSRVEVDNVTSNSISVSIKGGNAPYQLKYAKELCDTAVLNKDSLPLLESQNNLVEIKGLDYNANYYLYVRSTCDGKYSEWSNVEVVRTSCIDKFTLPFFEDFEKNENTGTKNNPDCWISFFTESDNSYPDNSTTAYSGERSVRVYTNKKDIRPYLVSQEIDIDDLSKCQMSFYMRPTATNKDLSLIIGTVSSIDSIASTFVAMDTISVKMATAAWEKYVISLEKYSKTAKYIAFSTAYELNSNSSNGVYLDDITIELTPTCAKPDYFELEDHTDKTISLSFVHSGAMKFEVKYGLKDFDVESAGKMFEITDTVFTITDLVAETEYDVYARAICSDTDSSPWSFAGTFETTAEPYSAFPYQFDFNDEAEAAKWRFVQNEQPNQWFIGIDTANVVADRLNNTDKALYISKDGGLTANYREKADANNVAATSYSWVYRTIYLAPGVYTISYDWTCFGDFSGSTLYDYVRVGLLPTTSKFDAGANKIVSIDGSSVNFTYTVATQPKGWYELSEKAGSNYRLNGTDTTKTLAEQWTTKKETIIVTDEQAGSYNLLFYWKNDASNTKGYYTERGAAIDNISISKSECNLPINFEIGEWDNNSVSLKWDDLVDAPTAYNVLFALEEVDPDTIHAEQIGLSKQVTSNDVVIEGLAGGVEYYTYVQSQCSETAKSLWVGPIVFRTLCDPQEINVVYDFDSDTLHYQPYYTNGDVAKNPLPNCFIATHSSLEFTSSNVSYYPYLIVNTTSKQYSRSGDYALFFNRTNKTTHPGGIIAMPAVDGDIKEMQLTFWMRAVDHSLNAKTLGSVSNTNVGTTYDHKITVGTMTNPNDPSTFVALDTIDYTYTADDLKSRYIKDDPNGNGYWIEVNLPLSKATGNYVAFKNEVYDDKANNKIYIDDIVISSSSCITPSNITFNSITSTSAMINAIHGESLEYVINIATDADFTQNLRHDTVTSLPIIIDGLNPATTYYVNMLACCDNDETSNISLATHFTTASDVCYDEEFATANYAPLDWSRAYDVTFEDRVTNQTVFKMYGETALGSTWRTHAALFNSGKFSTRHIFASIAADVDEGWLFSPFIELKETEKQHLVFDLALTESGTVTPISEGNKAMKDDRFIVVISDDYGKTWKRENAIIWGHSASDHYQFFDIPNTGKQFAIDLTKYAGQVIQVAFYVESTVKDGVKFEIHLDNVHINTYTESVISDAICQTEDYENEVFSIASSDLNVGENVTNELRLASKKDVDDVYYSLTVNVTPMIETNLEASICEGDVYAKYNFTELMDAGVYKQKHRASNGCDSVVTLNLSLIPAAQTMIFDTICYGNSVIWNGVEYSKTGAYTDTLVSAVTGCDSIVTFVLKVNDAIRSEQYVNICFGATYTFGTKTISESGNYDETFTTASGCDSIVTLHATVLPDYRKTINAVIKEGQSYNENGFVGLTQQDTYRLPLTSVDGCDSTITLNLTVLSADTTYVTNEITTNDLPFEYESLYYDENTQPGTYVDTLVIVHEDESKSVIVHTLIVTLYDAVDNVNVNDLMLLPNPVNVNNTLSVVAEFTSEERNGLYVEVFNAVGQCVYVNTPSVYPIQISGLSERGLYMVRITTGTGKLYQGKVVVK